VGGSSISGSWCREKGGEKEGNKRAMEAYLNTFTNSGSCRFQRSLYDKRRRTEGGKRVRRLYLSKREERRESVKKRTRTVSSPSRTLRKRTGQKGASHGEKGTRREGGNRRLTKDWDLIVLYLGHP